MTYTNPDDASVTPPEVDPPSSLQNSLALLSAAVTTMAAETKLLRERATDVERIRRRNTKIATAAGTFMCVVLLALVAMFLRVQSVANDTHGCVTPAGACYQQQQARAAAASAQLAQVANNNRYFTLIVIECAVNGPDITTYESCVRDHVGKFFPTPPK